MRRIGCNGLPVFRIIERELEVRQAVRSVADGHIARIDELNGLQLALIDGEQVGAVWRTVKIPAGKEGVGVEC